MNVNECCFLIDYDSTFDGPSIPFIRFDDVSQEYIFVVKTKSFLVDAFDFGGFLFSIF